MLPKPSPDLSHADPAPNPVQLAIVVSGRDELRAVGTHLQDLEWHHWGLFEGLTGTCQGYRVAAAACGRGEYAAYTAVRQLHFLLAPIAVAGYWKATSVREDLHAGDIAVIERARKCYFPIAMPDNIFESAAILYPSQELEDEYKRAPWAEAKSQLLALDPIAAAKNGAVQFSSQWSVPQICCGTANRFDHDLQRIHEFARTYWSVDAVDEQSYGFYSALKDVNVPGMAVVLTASDCAIRVDSAVSKRFKHLEERAARFALDISIAVAGVQEA